MGHEHNHNTETIGDKRLIAAIGVNATLTLAQIVGGILSGSLSLIADALHNLSDAASLVIALIARKIGRRPPDAFKTFGYRRSETIAALINLVTLIIVGLYLIYEAMGRLFAPQPIEGWTVVVVAGIALIVDIATAILTYTMSKDSMNIKAAFLHNVSDALASVGVVIAGTLILLYGWYWTDTVLTLMIAGYVLWQGFSLLPKTIHLLMEGAPEGISIADVVSIMERTNGVESVHHVHIWEIAEHTTALEAHVVIKKVSLPDIERVKTELKRALYEQFKVIHSTLEIELDGSVCIDARQINSNRNNGKSPT
ncbi:MULTISPECIES: cation diffusion facilitator family transporter [Pseudomonadaceae]|uniref:Cation efflux system protein n=2 Tax=Pseudomonadaceae TaxID=135621 RepID=A0A078LYN7_9PSED|nr:MULTISPECIES: cation diffusion facilitator family transporter [Pseudomonadaceae]MCP3431359.1 cation diffusion facilitator family transporter [Stutzerimonas stutzeri]RRV58379.1 cation transporter [Stutzerimonas stutzeri]RTM24283.1 cation transporter [Stutzerimonas stutzeri]CDZ94951.1 cation efflux system protein [Pseudomonas saudiphocaensis]